MPPVDRPLSSSVITRAFTPRQDARLGGTGSPCCPSSPNQMIRNIRGYVNCPRKYEITLIKDQTPPPHPRNQEHEADTLGVGKDVLRTRCPHGKEKKAIRSDKEAGSVRGNHRCAVCRCRLVPLVVFTVQSAACVCSSGLLVVVCIKRCVLVRSCVVVEVPRVDVEQG